MYWLCSFFLILSSFLQAGEIIKTSDLELIEKAIEPLGEDCLVLFDVDATLIVPVDAILRPHGKKLFYELIEPYSERDLFRKIRMMAPHQIVDSKSVSLVQKLQEKNIPILAFTAARAKLAHLRTACDWRIEELLEYGFDFSPSFAGYSLLELPLPQNAEYIHIPMFKKGVLFSSLHPKGEILISFLQAIEFRPKTVVFVDDDESQVQSVVQKLEEHGIECLGFHYTAVWDRPCEVDIQRAQFQIDHFVTHNIWLTDETILLNSFM